MALRRVRHRDHVLALQAVVAERRDRGRGVAQQPGAEARVEPCSGDDTRTVARTDARLVRLDERIQCGRVDVTLVDEDAFQGPHPQVHLTDLAVVGRLVP